VGIDDGKAMTRAVHLAGKGRGSTHPNPMVGAVLVKEGRIIGEGWHSSPGKLHAEILAIENAGYEAAGSTMYVNLEPCCHFGRTPPCTDAITGAGVKRVVVACLDTNPKVSGKGIEALRSKGVEVVTGVGESRALELNRAYFYFAAAGRPYVTLKLASSLDGRIATSSGHSRWITGEVSRRAVHHLRAQVDGVLVGAGTVLADDPHLTARDVGAKVQPVRIVLDPALKTPLEAKLVRAAEDRKTLLIVDKSVADSVTEPFREHGVRFIELPLRDGLFSWQDVYGALLKNGVIHLLVEGGSRTAAWFVGEGAVRRLEIFFAPSLLGGDAVPSIGDLMLNNLKNAPGFRPVRWRRSGGDLRLVADKV